MSKHKFVIKCPWPCVVEIPYALWGEVNYDSEGDGRRSPDQNWMALELANRELRQRILVNRTKDEFKLTGKEDQTEKIWITWYEAGLSQAAGIQIYPRPDFNKRLAELEHG